MQVIFHGCCSFVNKLDVDLSVDLVIQEIDQTNLLTQNNLKEVIFTWDLVIA